MTTKTDTEQLRAEFEAWASGSFELHVHNSGQYSSRITQAAFEAYQAGRAAQHSQDREDTARLNWLESLGSVDIVKTLEGKTEVFAPDDDMIYATGAGLRAAIDHARRIEENK